MREDGGCTAWFLDIRSEIGFRDGAGMVLVWRQKGNEGVWNMWQLRWNKRITVGLSKSLTRKLVERDTEKEPC